MDKKNTSELLEYLLSKITLVDKRFITINCANDSLKNDNGLEKLDSISMRLQTIGEAIKNILKTDPKALDGDTIYWSNIVRTREIILHRYIDINAEIIYYICNNELISLKKRAKLALLK